MLRGTMDVRSLARVGILSSAVLLWSACGNDDNGAGPARGAIEVTTTTTGPTPENLRHERRRIRSHESHAEPRARHPRVRRRLESVDRDEAVVAEGVTGRSQRTGSCRSVNRDDPSRFTRPIAANAISAARLPARGDPPERIAEIPLS